MSGPAVLGLVVPGLPQPLLAPEQNPGWQAVRDGFERARAELEASDADLLLIYSTMWPSVIGHQIQADPEPEWVHVDELFHDLGSMPYRFRVDADFAQAYKEAACARGLHARTVAYRGFPIDTGSVVALKLLNPDNRLPACIVSSNIYADRAETLVLGKAAVDALRAEGKKAAVAVVTSLSNRLFTDWIDPKDDRIHSPKDEEWNRKLLEFLGAGRLEDVAQLSREIQKQVRVHKVVNFKPMWWLSAVMGQHNAYDGAVHAYAPIYGAGAAVVTLRPSASGVGDKEFDEDEVEVYAGDRSVLSGREAGAGYAPVAVEVVEEEVPDQALPITTRGRMSHIGPAQPEPEPEPTPETGLDTSDWAPVKLPDVATQPPEPLEDDEGRIRTAAAPKPVGAYPHARRVGDLLFLSGIGPRQPGTDTIPGGPIKDEWGRVLNYDVKAQTRAVIENVKTILEAAGSSLDKVFDVHVFLVDMDRDFADFNAVYKEHFEGIGATRTTVAVTALPTPIAVEFKVIATA